MTTTMTSITAYTHSGFPVETEHATSESAVKQIQAIKVSGKFRAYEIDGRFYEIKKGQR